MCRIAGIWTNSNPAELSRRCITMRDMLYRGGPDDAGLFVDEKAGLALGHRRLSVIDLSTSGHQPMTAGRYTICYNGETYNYRELRQELIGLGHSFGSASDTEVVLKAFIQWGPDCVNRLNGMFAFAVWDKEEKALHLYRDRMGVKPLYYYSHGGTFAFASELKALHAGLKDQLELNQAALGEFFHYGYIGAPRSIYRHVRKLEPGHWLKISADHNVQDHCYWSAGNFPIQCASPLNEVQLTDQLEELMIDSFQKRLIADVPVGVFLSGGVDSSLVTAILARHTSTTLKTFTIGFNEKNYDEAGWARRIANHLGTEHTDQIVGPEQARAILPLWPEIYDEPFGDISGIPTTIVAQMTREQVKVSLSADGGDELFCGYHRYWVMQGLDKRLGGLPPGLVRSGGKLLGLVGSDKVASLSQVIPRLRLPAIKDRFRKLEAVLSNWNGSAASSYPYAVGYWLPDEIEALTGGYSNARPGLSIFPLSHPSGGRDDLLEAMLRWDLRHYLPDDILTKVDRATMFCSLEGRDPFLDHRLVEFALRLPMRYKQQGNQMKYILKQVLCRYLPREMFERPKQGFAVPIYEWLHDDLMHLVDQYLNPDALKTQSFLDPALVTRLVHDFKQHNGSVAVDRLWLVLVFMLWRERYGL